MTNCIETVLILLACGSIGAIFSSTAPDMGATGIVDRYKLIQPKILFVDSRVLYGGQTLDLRKKLAGAVNELEKHVPPFEKAVIVHGQKWKHPKV